MKTIETTDLIELERLRLESKHNFALSELERDAIARAVEAEIARRDAEMKELWQNDL